MRRFFDKAIGIGIPLVLVLALVIPYVYTVHDPNELRFDASLNQTTVLQGQDVTGMVIEQNKLLVSNDVPTTGNWRAPELVLGPCFNPWSSPFGIAVYQGRFTVENISTGRPMMIFPPGPEHCPASYYHDNILFRPLQSITYSVELSGNWTEGQTPQPGGGFTEGILQPFDDGLYTFAAGDQWGRLVLRYFTVLAG